MNDDVKATDIRNEAVSSGDGDTDRRDALAKIARFAAYTAPALLVIATAEKAQAVTGPPPT